MLEPAGKRNLPPWTASASHWMRVNVLADRGERMRKKHDGPSDHRIGPGGCRQRSVGRRGNPRKKRQAAARSLPENTDGLPDPAGFLRSNADARNRDSGSFSESGNEPERSLSSSAGTAGKVELAPETAKRYPRETSGGECQRAAIARALAVQPSLLICDEATSALDAAVQAQIVQLLKKLQREEELAMLWIGHDLALVRELCSRVIVMRQGKIVEQGETREVLEYPKEEYTKLLMEYSL